ncbi:hypothetical protein A9Q74_03580 [Colwellia sp. 39_35_sub15_T18]|nr:hypothetical protein A9Q74_03580 [Colwellia sp. 39_35_sub15_T18]
MSYESSQIANYFIDKAHSENINMSTLKLMKIVYIAHGWGLAVLSKNILGGEHVEAWQHGPVIPSLYHSFKKFGSNPIKEYATEFKFNDLDDDPDNFSFDTIIPKVEDSDTNLKQVLDFVWSVYKQYTGFDLVNMTHQAGTPWSDSFKAGERHVVIENHKIETFYKQQVTDFLQKAS